MFEIIFPGWLAGIVLTLATGPLGSFMVWRRMSAFGDTLSHSSLLGLAISTILDFDSFYSILFFIGLLAIIIAWIEEIVPFSIETTLSIISHSSLSLGIFCVSLMSTTQPIDINSYLFGDLLAVTTSDLITISIISLIVLSILIFSWENLLSATINEELAKIDGINLYHVRLKIMLTSAMTIAIAIKCVGALLVTSLLIIPPATAQRFSSSPEKMVIISIIISIISVTGGVFLSMLCNTPASPSIVVFSSFICLISNIQKYLYQ
ncbi:zinc ABC transporter permease subunit ZnuB [Buchnera aphidicola]|uniref:zinc ABC transporter permease subunit ZnuB n=1 Tax=Buchnera aphidicola TaxID=9 RepID=UPI0034644417